MPNVRIAVLTLSVLAGAILSLADGPMRDYEVRKDLQYATHDGVVLVGDYYVPKAAGKYPVVVAVHGGGWQGGTKMAYHFWGPYLAQRGIALYSIEYRFAKAGQPSYPKPVEDVRAAIQFVKYKADDLKADPQRVALMGDSAGGHLVALAALAADAAPFAGAYPNDPYSNVSAKVKAVVAVYGVYDLVEQWNHDQVARPGDQITEKFLGKTPMDDRKIYFEASPLSYATRANNQVSFFLTWGTSDDIVDPAQSESFLLALKQAGFFVRQAPVTNAPHAWIGDPLDEPRGYVSFVLPQILRFLEGRL